MTVWTWLNGHLWLTMILLLLISSSLLEYAAQRLHSDHAKQEATRPSGGVPAGEMLTLAGTLRCGCVPSKMG